MLGMLVAKAPRLERLIAPSAPDAGFFVGSDHGLLELRIDTGYHHQGFIKNFAGSRRFRALRLFEFGEYSETYVDDFATQCTPTEDYRALLSSPAFDTVGVFVWRNPTVSDEELAEMAKLRPDLQIQIVRSTVRYLRREI